MDGAARGLPLRTSTTGRDATVFRAILRSFLAGLRSRRGQPRQVPDLTLAGRAEAVLRDAGLTDWRVSELDGATYASWGAAGFADAGGNPSPHADRSRPAAHRPRRRCGAAAASPRRAAPARRR